MGEKGLGLVSHRPNLVAQNFGHCQFLHMSFFLHKKEISTATTLYTKEEYQAQVNLLTIDTTNLNPFKFQVNYLSTPEFKEWWSNYHHTHSVASTIIMQLLTYAFSFLQNQFTKRIVTYIKEINPFQHYFEVVYNLCDIHRTIYDASFNLKQKKY